MVDTGKAGAVLILLRPGMLTLGLMYKKRLCCFLSPSHIRSNCLVLGGELGGVEVARSCP